MKNILFLAVNPRNFTHLRLDEEFRDVQQRLERSKERDKFRLILHGAARPRDIQDAMLQVNPQIVHISGHGVGSEGLVFEDETGQAKFIKGEALADLFRIVSGQVECVILNSCNSNIQAKVINHYVPYVIGMNRPINDRAAIEFSVGFYGALGEGKSIRVAYELGCNLIQLTGLSDYLTLELNENLAVDTTSNSSQVKKIGSIKFFISYSKKDEDLFASLKDHLDSSLQERSIKLWDQSKIIAGSNRHEEINKHIESAKVILLLISRNYLSDSDCKVELNRAIEKHKSKEATVVPILLRPVSWQRTSITDLEVLPSNRKPISEWSNRDKAFVEIVEGIQNIVESL